MSTPSKKRRAAREWMHKAKERFEREGESRGRSIGIREGADRMQRDMMQLVPTETRHFNDEHGPIAIGFIDQFPKVSEQGPFYRAIVPMPAPLTSFARAQLSVSHIPAMMRTVDFRPIRWRHEVRVPEGRGVLEWVTWEPTRGNDEVEKRTSVLLKNFGKLSHAGWLVRYMAQNALMMGDSNAADLGKAGVLLDEAIDEIRLVLGRFAPEEFAPAGMTPREALDRYFFPTHAPRW